MKQILAMAATTGLSFAVLADAAVAGAGVPGPLLAAGAPALVLFAGGYYLIRRARAR